MIWLEIANRLSNACYIVTLDWGMSVQVSADAKKVCGCIATIAAAEHTKGDYLKTVYNVLSTAETWILSDTGITLLDRLKNPIPGENIKLTLEIEKAAPGWLNIQ